MILAANAYCFGFCLCVIFEVHGGAVNQSLVVLQVMFANQKVVLGVDRLDYTKGLVHRLRAFEMLLEKHPEHIEKVRLHTLYHVINYLTFNLF